MARLQEKNHEDLEVETNLRPNVWDDYFGQDKVKNNVRLMIDAAKGRNEGCDHLLFYGQAGLGKTTLAYLIGREMGAQVRTTAGPTLEKTADMVAILSSLEPNEILFVDEIHRMNRSAEEVLYPAMESRKLHLVVGKGPAAKTVSLSLPPFTMIAATTKVNLLSAPLRSRFGATFRLDYYNNDDIEKIIKRSSELLGVGIRPEAVRRLTLASRFTPRVANRLLRRARDYAQLYNQGIIDDGAVGKTLEMLEIDGLGLEYADRCLLEIIIKKFGGGPVGLHALGAALSEDMATISDVYEPYLMRIGFLQRTRLGRVATKEALQHFELKGF